MNFITSQLRHIQTAGLHRCLRNYRPLTPVSGVFAGRKVINFAGNDYLGLAHHPKVKAAAAAAVKQYGLGTGASRLVSGDNPLIAELERQLAALKGAPAALVYPTGYQANLGVITTLAGRKDLILADRLNHASLVDAALLSKAKVIRYPSGDMDVLKRRLAEAGPYRRKFIITDTVFSMDGRLAPLKELKEAADKYGAFLIVDDAHGTGVLGPGGAGAAAYEGVKDIPVQIGTMSKALGGLGGFAAADKELIELLINKSRPLIFSTALPPGVAAGVKAALAVIKNEPVWRRRLQENITYLRRGLKGLGVSSAPTPIIPIILNDNEKAVAVSRRLLSLGLLIPAIRPPSVPPGTARLRISVSAHHQRRQLDKLLEALAATVGERLN